MKPRKKAPRKKRGTGIATGSGVYNLLADMAADKKVFEAYKEDRAKLLERYDLTDEQKRLILEGGEENYLNIILAERSEKFGDLCL